jgi:hypothetical protein
VTSLRQIEANRRNRSTGPITEAGKHRSRRNAVRHGLCAETAVGTLEDIQDYKGFEAATQTVGAVPCGTAERDWWHDHLHRDSRKKYGTKAPVT